jgi:hypothetical protein
LSESSAAAKDQRWVPIFDEPDDLSDIDDPNEDIPSSLWPSIISPALEEPSIERRRRRRSSSGLFVRPAKRPRHTAIHVEATMTRGMSAMDPKQQTQTREDIRELIAKGEDEDLLACDILALIHHAIKSGRDEMIEIPLVNRCFHFRTADPRRE